MDRTSVAGKKLRRPTRAQDEQIRRYIDAARNNLDQKYNLCWNPCSTFVRSTLKSRRVALDKLRPLSGLLPHHRPLFILKSAAPRDTTLGFASGSDLLVSGVAQI